MTQFRFIRGCWLGGALLAALLLGWWTGRALHSAPSRHQQAGTSVPQQMSVRAAYDARQPLAVVDSRPIQPTTPTQTTGERLMQFLQARLQGRGALPGQAVFKFKSAADMDNFLRSIKGKGLKVLGQIDALGVLRLGFDHFDQLHAAMGSDANLPEGVDVNFVVRTPDILQREDRPGGSGSASFGGEGYLSAIGASGDRAGWGQGVTVAVVDSGVADHPTFGPNQVTHVDLVNDGQPFNGHGTAMASLIGGQDPQAPGIVPASHILDVRVADAQGISDSFTLAKGILQAVDSGAQIINISLGSYGDAAVVRDAVTYATSRGIAIVAAAGNDQTSDQLAFPASLSSVISVGGVDAKLAQAYFSNSGKGLTIAAPAVGIQSAYSSNALIIGDGTSQATALTSAVLAYGLSSQAATSGNAAAWLKQNALPLSLPPERGGAGMIQVRAR